MGQSNQFIPTTVDNKFKGKGKLSQSIKGLPSHKASLNRSERVSPDSSLALLHQQQNTGGQVSL
jgi:hypothetical protein